MKVRVFKDYDASVSGLTDGMPEGADPREHAVTTLRTSIINGIYYGSVTGKEFHYVVLPEPIILTEEDYPGEQWELICKVFGTPGASIIQVENYDISAFYAAKTKPETCIERLRREHPDKIKPNGRPKLCPYIYGYAPRHQPCVYKDKECRHVDCEKCWDRPVEEVEADET